jgi:hypothetical protein
MKMTVAIGAIGGASLYFMVSADIRKAMTCP